MTDTSKHMQRLRLLNDERQAETSRRHAMIGPGLRTGLQRLYGAEPGFDAWYASLLDMVNASIAVRPEALWAQDRERSGNPDWFTSQQMLGYSAYVEQFGGTLRGVRQRIDYLRELGVTYLHLLPFLKARGGENDGGFAVSSFDEVNPALGNNADLAELSAALRAAGISLCSDLLINHVADDHPWALAAKEGKPGMRDYFHIYPDREQPDRFEATLGNAFQRTAPGNFTWNEQVNGWVWTTFHSYQWDLNYSNPAVFRAMVENMLRLVNLGVEVFRLSCAAFLWKRMDTSCMDQPEVHIILQALRMIIDIAAPGVLLKAQVTLPTPELPAYFGEAATPACHLAYHSPLMAAGWAALAQQDTSLLRSVIGRTPELPPGASWVTYVRNHDDIKWDALCAEAPQASKRASIADFFEGGGFGAGVVHGPSAPEKLDTTNGTTASLAGLERAVNHTQQEHALRRLGLLYGLAMAFGGLPVIYMGDEVALLNSYAYSRDRTKASDERWVQRGSMDGRRRQVRLNAAGEAWLQLRSLATLRKAEPALAAGQPCTVLPAPRRHVLAFMRGENFLSLSNFSAFPVMISLRDMGAGDWPNQSDRILLEPWQMRWLSRDRSAR